MYQTREKRERERDEREREEREETLKVQPHLLEGQRISRNKIRFSHIMHPIKQMMHHKWSSTEPLHVFVRHACNSIRSFLRGSRRLAMKEWMGSFRVRGRPLFMCQRKREEKIRENSISFSLCSPFLYLH